MKNHQDNTSPLSALFRAADGVDTLETNSLCCTAAGIIAPSSATAEALIPHEKLRGAALADATLNVQERPLAQPVVGYRSMGFVIIENQLARFFCSRHSLLKIDQMLFTFIRISLRSVAVVINQKIINTLAPLKPVNTQLMCGQISQANFPEQTSAFFQSILKSVCYSNLCIVMGVKRVGRVEDRADVDRHRNDSLVHSPMSNSFFSILLTALINQNSHTAGDSGNGPNCLNPRSSCCLINAPISKGTHDVPENRNKYHAKPDRPDCAHHHSSRKFKAFHSWLLAIYLTASLQLFTKEIYGEPV